MGVRHDLTHDSRFNYSARPIMTAPGLPWTASVFHDEHQVRRRSVCRGRERTSSYVPASCQPKRIRIGPQDLVLISSTIAALAPSSCSVLTMVSYKVFQDDKYQPSLQIASQNAFAHGYL